jgi:hypothetical protein
MIYGASRKLTFRFRSGAAETLARVTAFNREAHLPKTGNRLRGYLIEVEPHDYITVIPWGFGKILRVLIYTKAAIFELRREIATGFHHAAA